MGPEDGSRQSRLTDARAPQGNCEEGRESPLWKEKEMTESTIPNTGDPRVDAALERIRGKFSDLEDAMLVQAHLEKGLGERTKEHAHLLVDLISGLQAEGKERLAKDAALDARVDKLVSSIGELISRIPPAALKS